MLAAHLLLWVAETRKIKWLQECNESARRNQNVVFNAAHRNTYLFGSAKQSAANVLFHCSNCERVEMLTNKYWVDETHPSRIRKTRCDGSYKNKHTEYLIWMCKSTERKCLRMIQKDCQADTLPVLVPDAKVLLHDERFAYWKNRLDPFDRYTINW